MGTVSKISLLSLLLLLPFLLSSLVVASTEEGQQRLRDARQCRIQKLTASRPYRRIESEGGVTELWDEFEDQFQCAGVAAMRTTVRPKSLSLPHYATSPRLVYIQQGEGLLGISIPGCPETYQSGELKFQGGHQQEAQDRKGDRHQKVQRIRQGDIIAVANGAVHWCYNDGKEDLVAVCINDLNNPANQLDQKLRLLYLAGEQPKESREEQESEQQRERRKEREEGHQQGETFQNVLRPFDKSLMANAFNIPEELVKKIQENKKRGFIVKTKEGQMKVISPEEEEQYHQGRRNGIEESQCNVRIRHNIDNPSEADVYSRQAGRLNIVGKSKLPFLERLDLSAVKGNLYPNAMHAHHYKTNAHSIVYITQGEGQIEVVDNRGETVFNDQVKEGDMLVIPQYYPSAKRAGKKGLEWVSFETSAAPLEYTLVGSTSAFKAMPLEVLTNSYQISYKEARQLKYNREDEMKLVAASTSSSY